MSFLSMLFVCLGCRDKIPQTWWLEQQKFISLQLQRLEVSDQDLAGLVSEKLLLGL